MTIPQALWDLANDEGTGVSETQEVRANDSSTGAEVFVFREDPPVPQDELFPPVYSLGMMHEASEVAT